jgi:alpha-beta hydrolase superfamily lysophospholipase
MTKDTFFLSASDGVKITVHRWIPDGRPAGIIQISHGMAEYAMRYDRFAEAAVAENFAVYAADHRGHGETAGSLAKLGYLADRNGFERVVEDQRELTAEIRKNNPSISVILFAHSFGSFIAQMYIEKYGDGLAGCILSGTRGPDPATVLGGRIMAFLVCLFSGKKKPSPLLTRLSFGACNKRISNPASVNSWISRDESEVEKYDASPWTGFICTAGFYLDLMRGLSLIHRPAAMDLIPKGLPIFILSGTDDPISQYGKTVQALAGIYKGIGIKNVQLTLYEGGRHESLNETNRDEVTRDILSWIHSVLPPATRLG